MSGNDDHLSVAAIQQIDEVCDRYEDGLRGGRPEPIKATAGDWSLPERASLIRELILIERHYAVRRGQCRQRADYESQLPDDRTAIDDAFRSDIEADGVSTGDGPGETSRESFGDGGDDSSLPARIGRYEIVRQLGSGGFGVVLLGRDPDLNRPVAIKRLKSSRLQTDTGWQTLRREAALAAQVKHPLVVGVYDIGREASGRPYFVMEYIEGQSLGDRLADGPLDVTVATRLAADIAEGIDHIHRCGLVHRDLKPANVLIDEEGTPKVADLGLAVEGGEMDDQFAGTFFYMAPEQLPRQNADKLNQHKPVDSRCDVWALGVILYEMLTGRRPFEGTTRADLTQQIREVTPKPPHELDARFPSDLSLLCMRCLIKDPHHRLSSAGELYDALRQLESGGVPRTARRHARAGVLVLVGGLIAAGVVAGMSWRLSRPAKQARSDRFAGEPAIAALSEPSPAPANAARQVSPFVQTDTGARFADLQSAVDAAKDGGIIEVDADGPVPCGLVASATRRFTLRAAQGRQPVLTVADPTQHHILRGNGHVVLEDLAFSREAYLGPRRKRGPSLIHMESLGKLVCSRCRFIFDTSDRVTCVRSERAEMTFDECDFYSGGSGIHWAARTGSTLVVRNCVARGASLIVVQANAGGSRVQVTGTTVLADDAIIAALRSNQQDAQPVHLDFSENFLDVNVVVRCAVMGSVVEIDSPWVGPYRWSGSRNRFAVRDTYLRTSGRGQAASAGLDDLSAWQQWCQSDYDSTVVEIDKCLSESERERLLRSPSDSWDALMAYR